MISKVGVLHLEMSPMPDQLQLHMILKEAILHQEMSPMSDRFQRQINLTIMTIIFIVWRICNHVSHLLGMVGVLYLVRLYCDWLDPLWQYLNTDVCSLCSVA